MKHTRSTLAFSRIPLRPATGCPEAPLRATLSARPCRPADLARRQPNPRRRVSEPEAPALPPSAFRVAMADLKA